MHCSLTAMNAFISDLQRACTRLCNRHSTYSRRHIGQKPWSRKTPHTVRSLVGTRYTSTCLRLIASSLHEILLHKDYESSSWPDLPVHALSRHKPKILTAHETKKPCTQCTLQQKPGTMWLVSHWSIEVPLSYRCPKINAIAPGSPSYKIYMKT